MVGKRRGRVMNSVEYPASLAFATWERATAAAAAKAKPAGLADGLKAMRKLYDAIDFAVFDTSKLTSVEDGEKCGDQIDETMERRVKPLENQAKTVGSAADKWVTELKKTRPEPSAAIAATNAVSSGA